MTVLHVVCCMLYAESKVMNKKRHARKKAFLIESNQKSRHKPKILRNRFLNVLMRMLFLRQIVKLFRTSVLLVVIFGGMFVFILFALLSPYFEIKQISVVRDNPHLDVEKIQSQLQDYYGKNLITLDDEKVKETLFENFPEFRSVKVLEKWPDEIQLKIQVSPPAFTLLNKETANFSTISADGIVLAQSPQENLPLITVQGYDKLIVPRSHFISKEYLESIQKAKYVSEEEIKLEVEEMRYIPKAKELHLILKNQTAIWLDLEVDVEAQLRKLELAASKIGVYQKPLHHIDLRIPDHLFWEE